MKESFIFRANDEIRYANNIETLVKLCKQFPQEGQRYLEEGHIENWLNYMGESELWNEYQDSLAQDHSLDAETTIQRFIKFCHKKNNFIKKTTDFLGDNSLEISRWVAATVLVPLSLYVVQQLIQDRIAKSDKEKALIQAQITKEATRDQYQQTALDGYITAITDLLKSKNAKDNSGENPNPSQNGSKIDEKDKFKIIAKAKTLTTLYLLYLDKERRNLLIAFLRDANYLSRKDEPKYKKIRYYLEKSLQCTEKNLPNDQDQNCKNPAYFQSLSNKENFKKSIYSAITEIKQDRSEIDKLKTILIRAKCYLEHGLKSAIDLSFYCGNDEYQEIEDDFDILVNADSETRKNYLNEIISYLKELKNNSEEATLNKNITDLINKIENIKKIHPTDEQGKNDNKNKIQNAKKEFFQLTCSLAKDANLDCGKTIPFVLDNTAENQQNMDDRLKDSDAKECLSSQDCLEQSLEIIKKLEKVIPLLANINLTRVRFDGIDLSDAILNDVNLTGADLRNSSFSKADMKRANLSNSMINSAFFVQTVLRSAVLSRSDLRKTNFDSADLSNAELKYSDLREANLSGANLSNAIFEGADLRGVHFNGVNGECSTGNLEIKFKKCPNYLDSPSEQLDPKELNQQECIIVSKFPCLINAFYDDKTEFPRGFDPEKRGMFKIAPKANLEGKNLSRIDLSGADLSSAKLQEADLSGTNLHKTNLSGADINKTNFKNAVYDNTTQWPLTILWYSLDPKPEGAIKLGPNVQLEEKQLSNQNLQGFDLRWANLHKAQLNNTDLRGSNLDDADLSDANLQYARIDSNALDHAYLCNTTLPNGNISNRNCGTEKSKVNRLSWLGDAWNRIVNFILYQ